MSFTALHRALGHGPSPIDDSLLDEAVKAGVTERSDLDWKAQLPAPKGIPQSDFPKDIAAMANSGGGVIVYGVEETQKAARNRVDVGAFDEIHERALRSAAITAITPPVFRLKVHRLGSHGQRAVVVEIPASVEGPHLIFKNDYFGAPVRNDSDTVWMREPQIEAMYRARLDERRHAKEALDNLYMEALVGRDTGRRAWIIAVAHPRIPVVGTQLSRERAVSVFGASEQLALFYIGLEGLHPIQNTEHNRPRTGLRRWVAPNKATDKRSIWKESWISIHHDGSVSLAAAVGGHLKGQGDHFEGSEVQASAIETAIVDFMAIIRRHSAATANDEYEIRVGIEFSRKQPLTILGVDNFGYGYTDNSTPLYHYAPVEIDINAGESNEDYYWHVHDLAQDCVNQGGHLER